MKKILTSIFTLAFLLGVSININACPTCGCQDNKEVKVCTKTGKVCDKDCENKKDGTCCKGETKTKSSCTKTKSSCTKTKSSCTKTKDNSFNFDKTNNYSNKESSCTKKKKKCCKQTTKNEVENKKDTKEEITEEEEKEETTTEE